MTTLQAQSLFHHIETKDVSAVVHLLHNGIINLDERDEDGQTFLMVSCQTGELEIVRELLQQPNMDLNAVDNDNWTALLNAAKEGFEEVVSLLLENGAEVDHRDIGGWTALMWACYKGHLGVSQLLIRKGANPNVKGEHHMSCLTWAAGRGYTEIVRLLLDHEAKVNTADKYGTTPLIWACRKGFKEIVEMLLQDGANVDNAGMNSWTALILAAKGGYADVVQCLLDLNPNVNAVDKDGFTALAWAAKDGHVDIVNLLLAAEAYVNLPDRFGDTILIHAAKGGHLEVSKALLKKYADVDVEGIDNKTALYWAVEKSHIEIARLLLLFSADTEIANKDGDTPLLKAVRMRQLEMVQLLMSRHAKVSAMDRRGETALHIAVRGRSKRVTEALLRNPKDARLLYKPNRGGDTPYQIDASHQKSILTQVLGARNLNTDEGFQGYELYSGTIADVLSEPSLHTPITIGLYAKWGSGKSFLIDRLMKEMKSFTQHTAAPMFEFSFLQFSVCFLLSLLIGVVLGLTVDWKVGLGVGLGVFLVQYLFLVYVWYGSNRRNWRGSNKMSCYLAKQGRFLKLLLQVVFCNVPHRTRSGRETAAVKFLFTDNARLASVVGEKSITAMICTLCDALEKEYGMLVTRLYRVFKPRKASEHGKFKSLCCIPYFLLAIFVFLCIIAAFTLLATFGFPIITDKKHTVVDSILIALAVIVGIALLSNLYTWGRMVLSLAVPAKKRVQKISANLESLKMEGYMQGLKKEVESIGEMTRCMDRFLGTHTRLVVIVDGLDSCEQEKLLQVLDTVHMLFSDQESPFITILAVDPHVIIKGIEHNLHGLFRDSSINGHDYLRNIVHLPFFLQSQTLPKPRSNYTRSDAVSDGSQLTSRGDSMVSATSYGSLPETIPRRKSKRQPSRQNSTSVNTNSNAYVGSTNLTRQPSQGDLSKSLGKTAYFSDINPRNMRRLINIIAVTSRLLRANHIDFSWYKVAAWINITEQWPYRLSWIILEIEDHEDMEDNMPLKNVYDRVQRKMPVSKEVDPLLEIDRNARKLELFLSSHSPMLNIGDLRRFLPCTINVDPYLRKLIRELQQNAENASNEYALYAASTAGGMIDSVAPLPLSYPPRRPQSCRPADHSPRATPIRKNSSISSFLSPYPPAMMMPSHHVMPQHLGYAQGSNYYPGPQFQPQPQGTMRPPSRVNIQGGLTNKPLSKLSVEEMCAILDKLDGITQGKVPTYQKNLQENNISGVVLLGCDLADLKGVMQMSFGDWEIFRSLVQALRDRELSSPMMKQESASIEELDDRFSPQMKFTQSAPPFDANVETPRAHYPQNTAKPQHSWTNFHSDYPGTSRTGYNQQQAHGRTDSAPNPTKKMKRQDSIVEVLMESQALHGVVEAVGASSGSDDEGAVDGGIEMAPITEEERSIADSSLSGNRKFHHSDDSADSDAEEMEMMTQKARQAKHPRNQLPMIQIVNSNSAPGGKKAGNTNAGFAPSHVIGLASPAPSQDESHDEAPLSGMKPDAKKIAGRDRTKEDALLLMNSLQKDDPQMRDLPRDAQVTPFSSFSDLHEGATPAFTPSSSYEHLALRKLAHCEDAEAPSAFKMVSPTSSRASSRASTTSGRALVSRETSMEGPRLSVPNTSPTEKTAKRSGQAAVSSPTTPGGPEHSLISLDSVKVVGSRGSTRSTQNDGSDQTQTCKM